MLCFDVVKYLLQKDTVLLFVSHTNTHSKLWVRVEPYEEFGPLDRVQITQWLLGEPYFLVCTMTSQVTCMSIHTSVAALTIIGLL